MKRTTQLKLYWAKNRLLAICSVLCMAMVTTSCSKNSTGNEPEGPGGGLGFEIPAYGLFLSVGGDANGLYFIEHDIAVAHKVGDGHTGVEEDGTGLTHMGARNPMIGSNRFALHKIALNGSGATVIGDPSGQAFTEGLAFDSQENVLYATSNGFLHIRNPDTGETIETVLSPPDQPDIEGLTFDPQTRFLYGLARGHEQQPQFFRGLYRLNTDTPRDQWVWEEIGDTGGIWSNAGLTFDPDIKILYAVGRMDDLGGLYRIDPETGNAERVGDTGLETAEGGLAWVPAE